LRNLDPPENQLASRRDITWLAWLIVAAVLVIDGARGVMTQEIYSKVRLPGAAPSLTGRRVALIGLGELVLGIVVGLFAWRNR